LAILISTTLIAFGVVVPFNNIADFRLNSFRSCIENKQKQFIALGE